jgi:SPP1 gp7 family putative phage head morphogenesis protein
MARQDLPRIHADDREALVSFLAARGIGSRPERARPDAYRPAQDGYSAGNLEVARVRKTNDRPIVVSSDRYVLDGHHQWFKTLLDTPLEMLDAVVLDAPIRRLVREAALFPGAERVNAVPDLDVLVAAISSGRISYASGVFSGRFSAALSRALRSVGARFDPAAKVYRVDPRSLPYGLRGALAEARMRSERLHKGIADRAAEIGAQVSAFPTLGLDLERYTRRLLGELERRFRASLAEAKRATPAAEAIAVPPDFSPTMVADIRDTLTHNLELSIKTFTDEEVLKVRELAEANWVAGGRVDLLREIIEERFAVTRRKAKFLAVQETSMVASEFARARAQEIGSSEYVWHCRQDDRVRPDHLELDGTTQSWDDPPVVDQQHDRRANPGMDFNCLPGDARVEFLDGIKKAFRRWYHGELTEIVTDSGKTLRATPNHPVLTRRGWKPICALNQSDEVVEIAEQRRVSVEPEDQDGIPTITEIFETLRKAGEGYAFPGKTDQFHGDGSDGDVDIVRPAGALRVNRKTALLERPRELVLAKARLVASSLRLLLTNSRPFFPRYCFQSGAEPASQGAAFIQRHPAHPETIGLRSIAYSNPGFHQATADHDSAVSRPLRDRELTLAPDVSVDDRLWIELKALSGFRFTRIVKISRSRFVGHVFNLETDSGYYATGNLVVSNCRCVARPILNFAARRVA